MVFYLMIYDGIKDGIKDVIEFYNRTGTGRDGIIPALQTMPKCRAIIFFYLLYILYMPKCLGPFI